MVKYTKIILEKKDGVAHLTINRPEKLNAMDHDTRMQIMSAVDEANKDRSIGCLVLRGAGERAFSAGQDISETTSFTDKNVKLWMKDWDELYAKIGGTDIATVAAINGVATGAGLQVALVCDIRIATTQSKFGMSEINIGIPCITGTALLVPIVGIGNAIPMVLTGELIPASDALRIGLVHHLVEPSAFNQTVHELANKLASKPKTATSLDKLWFRKFTQRHLEDAIEFGTKAHSK
ncbi:MAG TPA: enoyl-CoA hydratase/isomerase family protein, partial [Candidatus Hodarchaeales archaeon]|nr:enoyl-CoA hydratase/isomerase family protein [Candidatus Hodarchaeales archaeon]